MSQGTPTATVDQLPALYPHYHLQEEAPLLGSTLRPHEVDRARISRLDFVVTIGLLAIAAIVLWQRLWFWNGLAYLDIATFYLPWYAHVGEAIRAFDIPGWNPYQFSGTPFAGDPQSGWMYLPTMLFFTILNPVTAYEWFLVFHVILALLSTYAFARVLGFRQAGAAVAAISYAFGPMVSHVSCCLIDIQLAVWIPPALLGVEIAAKRPSAPGRLAGWTLAGFAVSQMMAGWVGQGAYNGCLVVGSYLAYRTLISPYRAASARQRLVDAVSANAVVFAISLGLAAGGLLPRLATVSETNVAGGAYTGTGSENYASGWTLSLLFDRLMGDGHGYFTALYYLGGATLTLMFVTVFLFRRSLAIPYFLGLTAVTTILTLEQKTLIHRLFYLLPRFEVLHEHVPTRVVAVQWIGPAMLAGAAIELILRGIDPRRLRIAAFLTFLLWLWVVFYLDSHGRTIGIATLAIVFVMCHAVAALGHLRVRANVAFRTAALALLCLAILWEPTGRTFISAIAMGADDPVLVLPTGPVGRDAIAINASAVDPGGAGQFLQEQQAKGEVFRYFGYDPAFMRGGWNWPSTYREFYFDPTAQALLINARAMRLGLNDVQGYDPVQLVRYVQTLIVANGQTQNYHDSQILAGGITSPLLNLLNVRYIVVPNEIAAGRPNLDMVTLLSRYPEVFRNNYVRVLENPKALPRAWAVHFSYSASDVFALSMIDAGLFDPALIVVLDPNTESPAMAPLPSGSSDTVTVVRTSADELHLEASLASDGMVVVSNTFSNGWTAYVDGKKTRVFQADGIISAIPVGKGVHTIALKYEPTSLRYGFYISIATVLGLTCTFGLVGIVALVRRSGWQSAAVRSRLLRARSRSVTRD